MDGSGRAALRRGAVAGLFLALGLGAGAASGTDNASFVSYSGVPTMMEPGDSKTVTVRMLNTGTSTWRTSTVVETDDTTRTTTRTSYGLNPIGDDVWGISRVVASGGVAPNSPYDFPFTITAPTAPGSYTLRWRMARRTIVVERPVIPAKQGEGFGAFTPIVTIVVKKTPKPPPDTAPSFGKQTVAPQEWLVGKAFTPLTLPEATGGNGELSYSLTRCLPGGVSRSGRRISGRPNGQSSSRCTWTVTDSDANTAGSDSDKLSFSITVKQAAFVVSPKSLDLHEDANKPNHSGTFTVRLDGKPLSTVTVSLAGWDDKVVTVEPESLTFSPAKFRDARTVKVTTKDDLDASDEATTINLSGRGGGYDGITSSVAVNVTDDDERRVIVNPTVLPIEEGETEQFTVRLKTQPTGDVTTTISVTLPSATAQVTLGATSLDFTPDTWDTPQPVKVTADEDTDTDDGKVEVTAEARGADYKGESATVTVNVTDKGNPVKPDLLVDPPSLTVKEGESKTFTVKLASEPTAGVTVSVESANEKVASVDKASLAFSTTRYGDEQTVRVTGKRNPPSDTTQINLRAKGGNYAGITKPVPVTIDGAPSFSERASNQVWERGRRVSVTLPVATGGNGRLRYALSRPWPAGVTFNDSTRVLSGTPATLQTATTYTYTVTDSDGNRGSGDRDKQTFTIEVVEPEPEPDPNTPPVFGEQVPPLKWTKDKAVSMTLPGATGGEGDLTYKLTPKPPDGVTFDPASRLLSGKPTATQAAVTYTYTAADSDDDTSAGDMARQSFTITVALPDTAPEFTEQAPDRHWVTGQAIETVTLPAATGGNGELTYALSPDPPDGVTFDPSTRTLSGRPTAAQAAVTYTYTAADADANTEDGDTATQTFSITVRRLGLLVSETELEATEGGPEEVFTVRLASEPSDTVTVEVRSADPEAVSVRPSSLTFTPRLWSEPMGVAVTGVPDPGFEDETTKVGLRAVGGGYDGVVKVVTVTVDDDDVDTVPELAGEFDALEWLAGRAIDPVVLPAGTGGNAPLRYSLSPDPPEGVTFDSSTRTLSGTPAEARAAATYTYTAADSDENTSETDAAAAEFTITVKQPALVSSKASLALQEGGAGGTFTVKLAARPKSDVTVSLKSGDAGAASVNPASLTFTTANHNVARTVTVKGVEDDDFDDEAVDITLAASGGGYDGETATVSVAVDDDETDTAPSFDGRAQDREWTAGPRTGSGRPIGRSPRSRCPRRPAATAT